MDCPILHRVGCGDSALNSRCRRTGITRGNGTATSYAFDPVSRLSSTTQDLAGTTSDQTIGSITYNPASQIQSQVKSNDVYAWTGHYNVNRNYTLNGLNQQTAAGATALGYDVRGNLTTSGTSTYTYNKLNQLTGGPGGAALTYDPAQRLDQIVGGSGTTRFAYVGSALIQETGTTGTILRRYVPGPGMDEPVVWYEGSGTTDRRWLHADERGSVIAVSDGSGTMLAINRYDEYGIPQATNVGRFQYTGQWWLPELGMYNYKARMYSPTLGRFMQTDPIGYGDGLNWYNYVGSDPINASDPSGLTSMELCTGTRLCKQDGSGGGSYVVSIPRPAARDRDAGGTRFTVTTTWGSTTTVNTYFIPNSSFGSGIGSSAGSSFGPGAAVGSGGDSEDIVVTARKRNVANQINSQQPGSCFSFDSQGRCTQRFTADGHTLELDPDYAKRACVAYHQEMAANDRMGKVVGAPGAAAGAFELIGKSLLGNFKYIIIPATLTVYTKSH